MADTGTDVTAVASHAPANASRSERWRWLLIWAGIATVAVITVLAAAHLAGDVATVLGMRGGRSAVIGRLVPVLLLSLVGLGLGLFVAWLAGSGRRREAAAVAIGLATLIIVRVYLSHALDGVPGGEPVYYDAVAESMLAGDPDLQGRPPAYSALLAVAYALLPDRELATEAVNLVLALLAGGAVLGLARGHYGPRVAALALLGYALWPAAALMTVVRIPQIAFDLVVVASAWAALGAAPGWKGDALTGVLVGLAQYLRPTAPILLPAFIVARWWPGAAWQRQLAIAAVTIAAFLLMLAPVMAYNLERTGSPSISTSDFGGRSLYIGVNEATGGALTNELSQEIRDLGAPDARAQSDILAELAIERIKADPLGVVALAMRKQDTLWGTERYGVEYGIARFLRDRPQHADATTPLLLSQSFYVLVLASALLAMILRRREPDALIPLVTLVIWAAVATHGLLEVRDRYHAYAVILLLPLSAYGLAWSYGRLERRVAVIVKR